jgi:hypothetical protein
MSGAAGIFFDAEQTRARCLVHFYMVLTARMLFEDRVQAWPIAGKLILLKLASSRIWQQ